MVTSSNCGTSFAWMNSSNWDKTQRLKSSECYKKKHNKILITLVFHPRLKPLIKHISLSLILTSLWRWISCVLAVEFPLIRPLICSCLRSCKGKKAEHDYFYDVTNADKKSVSSHLATIRHLDHRSTIYNACRKYFIQKYFLSTLTTSCLKSSMLCHWLRRLLSASCRLWACWSSWMQRSLI